MEITELLDEIQIEGAGQGDVVFIVTPANMQSNAFVKFASALRATADRDRADGKFFPRCIVLPPGTTVEVARAQLRDRIEIVEQPEPRVPDMQPASPDTGFLND